jgi:hypothetical protein
LGERRSTVLKTKPKPSLFAILPVFFGVLALASIGVLKHGFAPSAMTAVLAISTCLAFVTAIYVVGPEQGRRDQEETGDEDVSVRAEDEVLSYRRSRLVALGVMEEIADLLAADPTVSIQEMERLVKRLGCPVETALRIVWPA